MESVTDDILTKMAASNVITNDRCDYEEEIDASLLNDDNSDIEENNHTGQLCGYQTPRKNNLKLHDQAVHEGQKALHEGAKYRCNQCDHQATTKGNLVTHQQSVHMGIKFLCEHCDYQAMRKSHLVTHQQSVHMSSVLQGGNFHQ